MNMRRKTGFSSRPRAQNAGFALLITLTLLAFVVALLVALALYTRIETAISGNSQRQAQARENALLALDVALAELQRQAGPDRRVTATAAALSSANPHYTGVWRTDADESPRWLVSGSEVGPVDIATALSPTDRDTVTLVGRQTVGPSNLPGHVAVRLQPIQTPAVPGRAPNEPTVIGRYGWWVGDQGVKAPVAVEDRLDQVTYPPYDSAELRSRIRQQIGLGPGAVDANGNPLIEPRDATNAMLVRDGKVQTTNQLALLRTTAGTPVGVSLVQQNFHRWSPNNFAVLADTNRGGLRQDLSLRPDLLGPAFAAWADYPKYTEDPSVPRRPEPSPAYASVPIRRRTQITDRPRNTPVLSFLYIYIGVRKPTGTAPFTMSLRWSAAFWNPFTSAFVPEDLRLEIRGLPERVDVLDSESMFVEATFRPRESYGEPFVVSLPWNAPSPSVDSDKQSWLPGRVYNWAVQPGATFDGDSFPGRFDSAERPSFTNGLLVTVPGRTAINGDSRLALRIAEDVSLTATLVRRSDGLQLARYSSPVFSPIELSTSANGRDSPTHVGFLVRLTESVDNTDFPGEWLNSTWDARDPAVPSAAFRSLPFGPEPASYFGFYRVYQPERLLDREKTSGRSYNEDVPVFEIPRAPVLSLGMLQHLPIADARPFSIGNSWGSAVQVGDVGALSIFDRFFFSGLAAQVSPPAGSNIILPNPLLKTLRRADGERGGVDDLRNEPEARSSRFLLQGAAFNVNSPDPQAWAAVLRSIRYTAGARFTYLDADAETGTAGDTTVELPESENAHFFRFSHSAQEVFKADDDYVQSGSDPDAPVQVNTHMFRRGLRQLEPIQLRDLATRIAELVGERHGRSGPFRSLEEFLSPESAGAPSVLERAIADAGINATIAEFSSQWLTQGDILTALAPFLFPRSDTFLIRAYGEVVNPATGATEGRAWCEATVQRLPEYFDASQPAETAPDQLKPTNQALGRRFKVVSFRWLTRSDI